MQLQQFQVPQAQAQVLMFVVPTFRENSLLQEAGIDESEQASKPDAFLFYSNDEIRTRVLSDGIVGADQEPTAEGISIIRKTRISFEIHPSVFFEDSLLAEDAFSVNADVVKAMNENNPKMKALASILFGVGGDLHANISTHRAA